MEVLWNVECCNPGIGTDMVLGGKFLILLVQSKVLKWILIMEKLLIPSM